MPSRVYDLFTILPLALVLLVASNLVFMLPSIVAGLAYLFWDRRKGRPETRDKAETSAAEVERELWSNEDRPHPHEGVLGLVKPLRLKRGKTIAVVYASHHGQTEKISQYLVERLRERGYSTQLTNVNNFSPSISGVDGVIYGGPVYRGKFPRSLTGWVESQKMVLDQLPTALFTVSLNAADPRPEARIADIDLIRQFRLETGHSPRHTASFAGALKYRDYYWPLRLIMRNISKRAGGSTDMAANHEYTDWAQVDRFVHLFMESLENAPPEAKNTSASQKDRPLTDEEWEQVIL